MVSYANSSKVLQQTVEIRIVLAKGLQIVPGTAYLADSTNPKGLHLSDAVVHNGVTAGAFYPGAAAYIAFEAKTPPLSDFTCGTNLLRTEALVQPQSLNTYTNTADINLSRTCPTPSSS